MVSPLGRVCDDEADTGLGGSGRGRVAVSMFVPSGHHCALNSARSVSLHCAGSTPTLRSTSSCTVARSTLPIGRSIDIVCHSSIFENSRSF